MLFEPHLFDTTKYLLLQTADGQDVPRWLLQLQMTKKLSAMKIYIFIHPLQDK